MLYILQGSSGAGKSTLAEKIKQTTPNAVICSTDDLFYENGVYNFQPKKLGEYHQKNLENAIQAMKDGKTVIVDNTNVKKWESKKYIQYAHENNIPIVFIRVSSNFTNTHGVPQEKVEQMQNQMESLTVESVLASKSPWEGK